MVSKAFGKDGKYLGMVKANRNEKFSFITSFDKNSLYNSVLLYKTWLINTFCKASMIDMQIEDQSVKDQLYYDSGFREKLINNRRHVFSVAVNQIIDEDNFLSLQFQAAKKIAKFCILAKERGYTDIDIFDNNIKDLINGL